MGCGGSKTEENKASKDGKDSKDVKVTKDKAEKSEKKVENPAEKEHKEENRNSEVKDAKGGSSKGSKIDLEAIRKEALQKHNELRELHGCPPLELNPELCKHAQAYAEEIASENQMRHSDCQWGDKRVGENLAWCSGCALTGNSMSQMWYDEIKDYDFNNGTFSMETGHFTQLVWKESQELGIGVAQSSDGGWYGVANYFPAGNMMGDFDQNVPSPQN